MFGRFPLLTTPRAALPVTSFQASAISFCDWPVLESASVASNLYLCVSPSMSSLQPVGHPNSLSRIRPFSGSPEKLWSSVSWNGMPLSTSLDRGQKMPICFLFVRHLVGGRNEGRQINCARRVAEVFPWRGLVEEGLMLVKGLIIFRLTLFRSRNLLLST